MNESTKKLIQVFLIVAMLAAGARALWIYMERRGDRATDEKKQQENSLQADYYVFPKKLHAYDLKSAKELTKMPVWVREGYRYTYYPYDAARHHADFKHEAGLLGPLEELHIKDVVLDATPGAPGEKQVLAVFEKDGKTDAVPIGTAKGSDFQIVSDEMLFIQDPHQLYKHWPAEVWHSVEKHEAKPGMNELQVSFALGVGYLQHSNDPAERLLKYPNGGMPLTIRFRNDKVVDVKPG